MTSAQLINQDSGDVEYYTPLEIVGAARLVMGGIDLDPASSLAANERIKANDIFTEADDGLSKYWWGRVWLNHPFGRISNPLWVDKIVYEFADGHFDQGCCITFAATSEKWFQPLAQQPQCYLSPRTNYFMPDGSKKVGVTKGSVVTYFGPNIEAFAKAFQSFGVVKIAT